MTSAQTGPQRDRRSTTRRRASTRVCVWHDASPPPTLASRGLQTTGTDRQRREGDPGIARAGLDSPDSNSTRTSARSRRLSGLSGRRGKPQATESALDCKSTDHRLRPPAGERRRCRAHCCTSASPVTSFTPPSTRARVIDRSAGSGCSSRHPPTPSDRRLKVTGLVCVAILSSALLCFFIRRAARFICHVCVCSSRAVRFRFCRSARARSSSTRRQ